MSLLLLPARATGAPSATPVLKLPVAYRPTPDPRAVVKRYTGRIIDRIVGIIWWTLTLLGAGSGVFGIFNFIIGIGALRWWKGTPRSEV